MNKNGNCLKSGGALTVCRFNGGGGLGEKEGAFLRWGVDTPMHTMQLIMIITDHPKLFSGNLIDDCLNSFRYYLFPQFCTFSSVNKFCFVDAGDRYLLSFIKKNPSNLLVHPVTSIFLQPTVL